MSGSKRLVGIAFVVAAAVPLLAAPLTIRLATQAPSGTIWDLALADLGSTWKKDTQDRVTLKVFADGSAGDEKATVKKMQIESLDAGLLTAGGLSHIDKAFNVFTIPFFFETEEEELAVQKALEPRLEQGLKDKGFHFLAWGTGGWIQVFSKKPLKTLADVKAAKLYASDEDPDMVQWYTKNGFHPQALPLGDLVVQLKLPTGMIDTAPNTPYLALMTSIYVKANYMLDVHIAPLVGATVIKASVWNQLSQADRDKMTASARSMETSIRAKAVSQDATSITAMRAKGLQVVTPDKKTLDEFRAAAGDMAASMRGGTVPADVFDRAVQERDAARKSRSSAPTVGPPPAAAAKDAAGIEAGKAACATQKCATCHAIKGAGSKVAVTLDGVGTKLTAADIRKWLVTPAAMESKLAKKPAAPMSGYMKTHKLTDVEVEAITTYLVSLKEK